MSIATSPRRVVRPVQEFISSEAAGGVVLFVAALAAIAWANSLWSREYFDFLPGHLSPGQDRETRSSV